MNVIFLSEYFWPHVGGVEKHVEKISEELIKNNHDVTVITLRYDQSLRYLDSTKNIQIIRFDQSKIKYLGLIYTWFWMVKNRNLFEQSDVIHIHDVFIWYLPLIFILPKKVYVTHHGSWAKYPIPFIDKLNKKLASFTASGSLVVGEYINKWYKIDSNSVTYGASDINNNPKRKDSKSVLYLGRLDEDTSLKEYFKFLDGLRGFKIEFLGDGKLKNEAAKHGKVYGFVEPTKYLSYAKYVLASGYLSILEAMANRCLVFVLYETPLQEDYYELTPFKDFMVIAKNSKDLLNKFNYYKEHTKEAGEIITKGYKLAKEQTWEKLSQEYLLLWKKGTISSK